MRFDPAYCPDCNLVAYGTQEMLPGIAQLNLLADGSFEHSGTTDVLWDAQTTPCDEEGKVVLTCSNGHEWFALLLNDEDEEEEPSPPSVEEDPPIRRIRRFEDRVSENSEQGGHNGTHLPREGLRDGGSPQDAHVSKALGDGPK